MESSSRIQSRAARHCTYGETLGPISWARRSIIHSNSVGIVQLEGQLAAATYVTVVQTFCHKVVLMAELSDSSLQ
ncbi:hypothetical protein CA13_07150 [Planctomycetes bacterium CA13]|uniref:Uncharacterized protein n=1 Tax=Novipirellula herctigrandis TaxID=2527986 RepID=A0A5C5YX06_9BACT|nr:hypothetical protein CA13_07150 [Planctomycetes bacterium CA13]